MKKKIGILGGGQLGKMLCLAAADWDLEIFVLDTEGAPAQSYCKKFVVGDFKNYDDVLAFGRQVDILTIEIEHVNVEALKKLAKEGVAVHPNPKALSLIKDKGLQKAFYEKNNIPTSKVAYFDTKQALETSLAQGDWTLPAVWKSRTGGYDGKGVAIIETLADTSRLPDTPCILEEKVDIALEIAVIVARNPSGQVVAYPAVEMLFDAQANLLDFQLCPANIDKKTEKLAQQIAKKLIKKFDISGLLAVEFFVTRSGELLVNEVAPRPHNSGHHSIEAIETSQFEQHLRGILDWPLGDTQMRLPSVLVNLLGAEGHSGTAVYEGLNDCLALPGLHIHLYGKSVTKPFRKMGHATILNRKREKCLEIADILKTKLRIISE